MKEQSFRTKGQHVFGILLILVLAAGVVLSAMNPGTLPRLRGDEKISLLLSGEFTGSWQEAYDRNLPIKDFASGFWGSIRYGLFREGLPGVVAGRKDWLFTLEEFIALPSREDEERRSIEAADFIASVGRRLKTHGAELMVLPVPAKADIYPDMLGRYAVPAPAENRYAFFLKQLRERGMPAVDLYSALTDGRVQGKQLFLRTDTHWSPAGAEAAAGAAAAQLRGMEALQGVPGRRFEIRAGEKYPYTGDLMSFIPLGPFYDRLAPEPDIIPRLELQPGPPPALGLFDDAAVPIVLIGTSYSAGEAWGFDAFLQSFLQIEVLNLAEEGAGPYDSMLSYLESDTLSEAPPAVVLWEFPVRYLAVLEVPEPHTLR